ncbi:MAG: redoxin domain-containing protein, partial [Gammaproteobacteria bacterium]|nr:redoxin domain-containing protein [Gammaproteobacteria bacterium]
MLTPAQDITHLEKHQVIRIVKYRILQAPAILMLACLLSPLSVHGTQLEPYTGEASANFTLKDTKDQTHSLSDYKGKVVLDNFWASWCPPCTYEMPELKKPKKRFADRPFQTLAV